MCKRLWREIVLRICIVHLKLCEYQSAFEHIKTAGIILHGTIPRSAKHLSFYHPEESYWWTLTFSRLFGNNANFCNSPKDDSRLTQWSLSKQAIASTYKISLSKINYSTFLKEDNEPKHSEMWRILFNRQLKITKYTKKKHVTSNQRKTGQLGLLFINLKGRVREIEHRVETELFYPLVCSPNSHNKQVWA